MYKLYDPSAFLCALCPVAEIVTSPPVPDANSARSYLTSNAVARSLSTFDTVKYPLDSSDCVISNFLADANDPSNKVFG